MSEQVEQGEAQVDIFDLADEQDKRYWMGRYPAERMEKHLNGGGMRGSLVTCSDYTYLDADTVVHGVSALWGSPNVVKSKLWGNVRVSGVVRLWNVVACGFVNFHDEVQAMSSHFGTKLGSEINLYDRAKLDGCSILTPKGARVEIGCDARLIDVVIRSGSCYIAGDAFIKGVELEADTWLHTGIWERPPLIVRTDKWAISECVPGYIHCQCQCHPIEKWERSGAKAARYFGLTEQEFKDCEAATRELIAKLRERDKYIEEYV